ncbi:MAG: CoA transferase [Chloroflexi bacterium]|nr:CoA transferase [Chloroflexota bacterium]MCY3697801.1 CoA transferase [Chloroflexota bacterium]MXX81682.1 CoA transferase [Chloroflexota bacterium]
MTNEGSDTLLQGVRVLDLATPRAEMTGRVLADMGAEVIKVEPPAGADARRLPPFSDSEPGRSLYWAQMGLGKRSVVIDLDSAPGRDEFRSLLATADVLIESFDPGTMASLGLGYDDVKNELPDLIYVSVTPYGQDGPHADRPATDLTLESAGGLVGLQGDGDRPPVPVGLPQASIHAGVQAAADTSIALRERELSGLGQHLDVSMQAAVVWTLMNATGFPPNTGGDPPGTCAERGGGEANSAGAVMGVHPCLDGYIVFSIVPGGLGLRHSTLVLKWIEEEGELTGELEGVDIDEWAAKIARLVTEDPAELGRQVLIATENMHQFVAKKTMAECFERAVRDSFMMAPLYTMEDIANDSHLAARDFWVDIDGHRYPGPFAKLSETPLQLTRPAPALGQDQHLLAEVDGARRQKSRAQISANGVRGADGGALHGVKIADFAWVGVGPLISKSMADHGATVVHIESATRPDVLRLAPPFKDNEPGMDRAQFMANFNSSKIGVALRLDTEQGHEYARQLIEWADVVVESFTPGTMKRFGFDYATLSQERPELIMLSTCLRGQSGPESTYPGFGLQGACLSGLHRITGWPDRQPAGTWGAYTDFINPRFGSGVLAAAIRHRDLTGKGQYIDLAQSEAGIHFAAPLLLDYLENGRVARAPGHDSMYAAPNGVFRVGEGERYVAIASETAEQWSALRDAAGLEPWSGAEYDDLSERIAAKSEIEAALADWCAPQTADAVVECLTSLGVPASVVQWPSDLYQDAQLKHRNFFVTLNHSVMGPTPYDGLVTRFSGGTANLRRAAPAIGEHTHYVLSEILNASDDEITDALVAGVLQ